MACHFSIGLHPYCAICRRNRGRRCCWSAIVTRTKAQLLCQGMHCVGPPIEPSETTTTPIEKPTCPKKLVGQSDVVRIYPRNTAPKGPEKPLGVSGPRRVTFFTRGVGERLLLPLCKNGQNANFSRGGVDNNLPNSPYTKECLYKIL